MVPTRLAFSPIWSLPGPWQDSHPTRARSGWAALGAFARWAWERGHLPEHIGAGTKRAAKEKPRERVLSLDEVRAVWQATHAMGDLWGPFLRILTLTAQRRGDVAGAR